MQSSFLKGCLTCVVVVALCFYQCSPKCSGAKMYIHVVDVVNRLSVLHEFFPMTFIYFSWGWEWKSQRRNPAAKLDVNTGLFIKKWHKISHKGCTIHARPQEGHCRLQERPLYWAARSSLLAAPNVCSVTLKEWLTCLNRCYKFLSSQTNSTILQGELHLFWTNLYSSDRNLHPPRITG